MATTSRTRTGDQLRKELLAAATELLSQRLTVSPPSLRETARACGVSATAVYRHFPSQQALLGAIAGQSLASLVAAIDEHGTELVPDDDAQNDRVVEVRRMAVSYATWAVANPGGYQLLFEGRDILDEPEPVSSGVEALQHRLESLLRGVVSDGRDERLQAELLWIALHGLVVTRIRKTEQDWGRTLAEDAVSLVDVFVG